MELLRIGQRIRNQAGQDYEVVKFLGGGAQGEVYRARLGSHEVAIKWYFPYYVQKDTRLLIRLRQAIHEGSPANQFLWPMEILNPDEPTFGYVMPMREPRFKGLSDLLKRTVDPEFRALTTACLGLAEGYFQLHSKGFCYHDINASNVFFDPDTGEIRICDNDNVDVNKVPGSIAGTMRFMAPEIVRRETTPSITSDQFSLAVLMYYMLMIAHPFEGKRENDLVPFGPDQQLKLYGTEVIFIYDPQNEANRPDPMYHQNAVAFWPIYPQFLRDAFTRAFTEGLNNTHSRITEGEWRRIMVRLRDSIVYCQHCNTENFYDAEALQQTKKPAPCWSCGKEYMLPPRIRIVSIGATTGATIVMLNRDTKLYDHHINDSKAFDFTRAVGEVSQHPTNPNIWGLRNTTDEPWTIDTAETGLRSVEPGRNVAISLGMKINFGKGKEGEIRL
jgi:eukaryotic-like serine/threonine-protein kinase